MTKRAKPRKTPVQSRSQHTVDAIVEAGARILAQEGYRHMTTNRVAEVAGVSIGSLYQYFADKEAVLVAVFQRHQNRIREAIGGHFDAAENLQSYASTRNLIAAVVRAHGTEPKLHARLENLRQDGALPSHVGDDHLTFVSNKLEASLKADFAETIDNPALSARVLVTAVHALIQAYERGEFQCSRDAIVDDISQLVFNYVSVGTRKGSANPK